MYKHILNTTNQYLTKDQELPKNETVAGNNAPLPLGGTLGAIELVLLAETPCTLTGGKSLTLSLLESGSADGVFTEAPTRTTYTPSATKTWNAGECIVRLPLSSYSKMYVKALLATTDSAVTGTVSIFPSYLPR